MDDSLVSTHLDNLAQGTSTHRQKVSATQNTTGKTIAADAAKFRDFWAGELIPVCILKEAMAVSPIV